MQASSINYTDLNQELRIDAEYYRAEILERLSLLENKNNETLNSLVDFVVGPFGSTVTVGKYIKQSCYRYIRNKNINNFRISNCELALITKDTWSLLPQFHIQENDLLITVVGTLGKVAIATGKDSKSIFSCKSTILRVKNINPFYLLAYLNSDTGKLFSLRGKRGAIQEGLNLTDLKEIQVFVPSEEFQSVIEEAIRESFTKTEQSEEKYKKAQTLLLSELGLTDWQPRHQLTFIKNYSDTKQAGRIDAEYFQPKYDDIINTIKSYKGGWDKLGRLCDTKRGSLISESFYSENSGEIYIRGTDFSGGALTKDKCIYIDNKFVANNETKVTRGEIVFSLIGSVGESAIVTEKFSGSYISNNTGKITCGEDFNPTVLQVLLKSIVGQMLFAKYKTQTAQPKISDKDIRNFILPKFSTLIQTKIQKKITETFSLRKQSKHLLECAKRAVEMAIEQDEQIALRWLKEQIASI